MIYKWEAPITTIVLHNTAVSRSVQALQLDSVNNHHKGKWNMASELGYYVGYNFFCEATGERTQTRKIGEETIAQIGNNCDDPSRCGMVSYCMSGYFEVEKPTQYQVNDFIEFHREIKSKYPSVVVKQHKDVYPGRTCAELTDEEIQSWLALPPTHETKDRKIARLEGELARSREQVKQLIGLSTQLIKLLNK